MNGKALSYQKLMTNLKSDIDPASRVFSESWSGGIQFMDYPIIDMDTFTSIRKRGHFSRTWYSRGKFTLPKKICEFVFYFASCSKNSRVLNEVLGEAPTLHLSWLDAETGRYVDVWREKWCRVKEFVHDGNRLGIVKQDKDFGESLCFYEDSSVFQDWFAMLLQDMLRHFSDIEV
jgi:hypothetical protein